MLTLQKKSQLATIRLALRNYATPERAEISQRFFKTGPGQYGEGDIFLGLTVPDTRKVAKIHKDLSFEDIFDLLHSTFHEERLAALLILVDQFKKGDEKTHRRIFEFYLSNTVYVNNWDLVDLSAEHIVGVFLENKNRDVLYTLARSANLWERRIAMLATFHYIKKGESDTALKVAKILLHDHHDLIQKAVGWMLREIGKRCSQVIEEEFLRKYYKKIPRTMLRYAIERFPEDLRKKYLEGSV